MIPEEIELSSALMTERTLTSGFLRTQELTSSVNIAHALSCALHSEITLTSVIELEDT